MPRESTKRVTPRVPVESSFSSSGLVVAARETTLPIPRDNYNPQVSADMQLVQQALSQFIPTLAKEAREKAIEKEKTDFIAGQAARLAATEEQLNNYEAFAALQSPSFMRGYDHTSGAARATELGAQLTTEYETIKDQLVTPGQYDKWMSGRLQEALKGVDSADFKQGFLEHITRVDDKLRASSITNNFINIQQSAMADLMTATKGSIVSKIEGGDTSWVEDFDVMRDKGRMDGLSHQAINEMQFEILEEVAVARGQPELMDQAFGRETVDTEDTSRTIPPLASSPKWSGRIADVKARATAAASRAKAERDEVAKLGHYKMVQKAINDGNYSKAKQLTDAGVENKMYSADKAMSLHDQIRKQEEDARVRRDIGMLYDSQQFHLAAQVPGYTKKAEEEVAAAKSNDRWVKAGQDPLKQEMALQQDIIDMNNSGVVIPKYKEPFDYTASSATQFQAAHELAKRMDSVAPGASHRLMESAVAIQHDFYETMLDSGMDPIDAVALTRQSATPEKREAAARQMGFNRKAIEERVTSLAIDSIHDGGWLGFSRDAMDTAYAQNAIYNLATQHVMASGEHADPLKSIEWAATHFKNTHRAIRLPGTDTAYYLQQGNYEFPEEMDDAVQHFSEKLKASFEGTQNYNEVGYYPQKLDDDTYAMHYAGGPMQGLPVMGKNGPFRVEPRRIVSEYIARNDMTMDEVKSQHAEAQAERKAEHEAEIQAAEFYREQTEANAERAKRYRSRKRP